MADFQPPADKLLTQYTDKELIALFDEAFHNYKGNALELERAIGTAMVGRHIGWKPLFLMQDRKTIAKYEKILGINFRDSLPEAGKWAHRTLVWKAMEKITNFWKAVRGEVPGIKSSEITKG